MEREKKGQFIVLFDWMLEMAEIESSTELIAYALIYSFSQNQGQYLICRQTYIANWLKISRPKCNQLLSRMEKKGLIEKVLNQQKGIVKTYKYHCIFPRVIHDEFQKVTRGVPKGNTYEFQKVTCTSYLSEQNDNNIYNNIYNNNACARKGQKNPVKKTSSFNQFMQSDGYDFEQLESELACNLETVKSSSKEFEEVEHVGIQR